MTDDPVRNAAVAKCLNELMTLKRDWSVEQLSDEQSTTGKFAPFSLQQRKRIEEELRAEGKCSDFDSLALGAFQEALREAVVRGKGLGVWVSLKEVAERLQEIKVLDLWCLFVRHYLGNIFEWQAVAARVDKPDDVVRGMRRYAKRIGVKILEYLKDHPSQNQEDADSFLRAFEIVATEEARKAKKAKEAK